jgi:hypothetical protein
MFQALRISRGKRHWPGGCPPPVTVNQDPDWRFAKLRNRLNGGKSGGEMPLELSIAVPAGCLQSLATVVNHLGTTVANGTPLQKLGFSAIALLS